MKNRLGPICVVLLSLSLASATAAAQTVQPPYDDRLVRLSEIVGAVHYLRTLCSGSDEGWRDRMQDLIDVEADTAERRARMIAAFNKGYRSFASVYRSCTDQAIEAEELYRKQGLELASEIIARYGN